MIFCEQHMLTCFQKHPILNLDFSTGYRSRNGHHLRHRAPRSRILSIHSILSVRYRLSQSLVWMMRKAWPIFESVWEAVWPIQSRVQILKYGRWIDTFTRFPACLMLESAPIRLVRPSAVIITHKKVSVGKNYLLNRVTVLAHTIFKNSKKAVYGALF